MPKKIMTPSGQPSYAVLLIDMQDGFVLDLFPEEKKRLVTKQKRILRECARLDIPIIVTEYFSFGETIEELRLEIAKVPRHWVVLKMKFNTGFYRTGLTHILKELGVDTLVLTGINASHCVADTAESAIKKGYRIVTGENLIADCSRLEDQNMGKSRAWFSSIGTFYKRGISLKKIIAPC
ncbi:MAG: isochorismatase family cysteine hydrolase [Candidatus Paceibacterota bacterium]|jgi:nicotinamidase-related amidase